MQSAQGSCSPSNPTTNPQQDATTTVKKSLSIPPGYPSQSWERTGTVAGTAISLAASLTLPLPGQAIAHGPITEVPSSATASLPQTDVSTTTLKPTVSPDPTTQTRFGTGTSTLIAKATTPDSRSETAIQAQNCQTNPTCKGIEFIDAKLPELQKRVQDLRTQMQQFQGERTAQNLETHRAILANRAVEIAQQRVEIGKQLSDTELQLLEVQTLLAMQPYEANFAEDLLTQDANYQNHLQQLADIDQQIAVAFSQPELNQTQLETLYTQYNQVAGQLYQDAQEVLARFVAISQTQAANPLWQEPMYYDMLQQLMTKSHQHQVLAQRNETISHIEKLLQDRRATLANYLREYASLQQQLETQTQVLQDYIVRRQILLAELNQPQFAPPPRVSEPELATISATGLWQLINQVPREMQQDVALALLMGAGILTALARHQSYQLSPKDYQLRLPQTELVAEDIPVLVAESQQSLVSIFETYSEKDFEIFSALAIAIVLQTFQPAEAEPLALPMQLMSELSGFAWEPVALPMDDIDLFADEAIEIALNGLDLDLPNEPQEDSLLPEEILQIFGAEIRELVTA